MCSGCPVKHHVDKLLILLNTQLILRSGHRIIFYATRFVLICACRNVFIVLMYHSRHMHPYPNFKKCGFRIDAPIIYGYVCIRITWHHKQSKRATAAFSLSK